MTKTAKDRDRALAMAKPSEPEAEAEADGDAAMEDAEETPAETAGSKVIVIHIGSQNLRIGLASDALPKTVPMVIARKSATNESEDHEEPNPKRLKRDDGSPEEPENLFGPEVRWRNALYEASLKIADLDNSGPLILTGCRRTSKYTCVRTNGECCPTPRKWW